MAGFKEILFPANISYGSSGGPKFKTTIFTSDSGYEQRNIDWSNIRSEFDVSHGIKDQSQMDELTNFFMVVNGRAYGFRYKDWNDFSINLQQIGVGDGSTTTFQLVKTYTYVETASSTTVTYTRRITKPSWSTIAGVTVDGTPVPADTGSPHYTIDYTTGILTFSTAPGNGLVVAVGAAEFHIPVRFDDDALDVVQEFWNTSSWNSIKLVEVREWGEALV